MNIRFIEVEWDPMSVSSSCIIWYLNDFVVVEHILMSSHEDTWNNKFDARSDMI